MPVASTPAAVLEVSHRYEGDEKQKARCLNFSGSGRSHEQWARFRFSVIGPSLAAPPERGDLQEELKSLAAKNGIIPSADNGFNYSSVVRFMKVQG